jgi:hypothetical protein
VAPPTQVDTSAIPTTSNADSVIRSRRKTYAGLFAPSRTGESEREDPGDA